MGERFKEWLTEQRNRWRTLLALVALVTLAWVPGLRAVLWGAVAAGAIWIATHIGEIGAALWYALGCVVPLALLVGWLARKPLHRWWFDDFWSWRHRGRFRFRIACRVRWLAFKLWWRSPKFGVLRRHWRRPALLGLVFVVALLIALLVFPAPMGGLFEKLHKLMTARDSAMDWREATQLLLVVVGLPFAFLLWLFRDIHVNSVLENQRKDVNLKEFQEIQMRAAGAIDQNLPERSRETLQIAAAHQLGAFLRGDYGEGFRRPAWELLRARLLASSERMGYRAIADYAAAWHAKDSDAREHPGALRYAIERASLSVNLDGPGRAQRDVLSGEWRKIFRGKLPLTASCFDGIDLAPQRINYPGGALLAARSLARCTFVGAYLESAHLEDADLGWAHLEGADLRWAHLEGAYLDSAHLEGAVLVRAHLEGAYLASAHLEGGVLAWAHLEGAYLSSAHLEGADLGWAHLEGADLSLAHLEGAYLDSAHLEGADLGRTHLEGADLRAAHLGGAKLNAETSLVENWEQLTELERNIARRELLDRGAIFVDRYGDPADLPPDDTPSTTPNIPG